MHARFSAFTQPILTAPRRQFNSISLARTRFASNTPEVTRIRSTRRQLFRDFHSIKR